jgi:hypothetical protein
LGIPASSPPPVSPVGVLSAFLAVQQPFFTDVSIPMSRIVSHAQKAIAGTKRHF